VGLRSSRREILVAAAFALAAFTLGVVESPSEGGAEFGYVVVGIIAALAVGLAVRQLGFETDTLAARAAEAERTRDESARAAVAAERARIARELHDVIGHSISVMGVQAGAVRRVLPPELEREREALLGVERVGRDAVTEMRRLLGFLRPAEGLDDSAPTPTLERLDDLVAEMRRAGLAVDLVVEGELGDLSAGRTLTAFRILQEALTNTLKHAPGSHDEAMLRRSPEELVIEVRDDGANGATASSEGGYGLLGMRERLALYGGTLEAGPQPERGYAIVARLPTVDP
jgi:signal transduction histidine kinase